mmetsp:Transcript_55096/g.108809  ORF Transcript_55096/g.108809 Transcript_55096/m.108809 type:complete len:824 (+) Transcript_55096:48-2519(+)
MSGAAGIRNKFKFFARVEYVTEELDHAGNMFYMFNIKVIAEPEGAHREPLQWSVIKSEDEFLQTHKVLKNKYGLLKNFHFRNPSAIGSNSFHLTNAVKPRREKKDEYLTQILLLDPIPDEINAFLCLDNASYFTTSADGSAVLDGNNPVLVDESTATSARSGRLTSTTPTATPAAPYLEHTPTVIATPLSRHDRAKKQWWLNFGLLISCLVMLSSAWFLSSVMSTIGTATGISNDDAIVMIIAQAVGRWLHYHLMVLRARLEVIVIIAAILTYSHRVLGYALGLYLRSMLDRDHTGKFAFHFEWIALRLGLDQNMIVIKGIEWRNPPMFRNTPYLLRIDEVSFTVDAMSVYNAFTSKGKEAIRVNEIRFNKVYLHIEKLAAKIDKHRSLEPAEGKDKEKEKLSPSRRESLAKCDSFSEISHAAVVNDADHSDASHIIGTGPMKPGVLNLWAAMGATNPQQEASMLSNVSGQMNAAVDGTTNMISVLGNAVSKYNPATFILKSGMSVGSTIGSSIGAGVGMLTGHSKKQADTVVAEDAHTAAQIEEAALKDALDQSLEEEVGDMRGSDTSSVDNGVHEFDEADLIRKKMVADNGAPSTTDNKSTKDDPSSTGASSTHPNQPKKGFGFPYLLDIDALQLDRLELHTQDFLNASHATHSKASVIKLKTLSMSHRELTKPPKPTKAEAAADPEKRRKRRPLYLDDVVWRLVNHLLADLLKNNSIAMMVLLSSAAANNTASVVTNAGNFAYTGATTGGKLAYVGATTGGKLAYAGAATGGKLLSSVGSVFVGGKGANKNDVSSSSNNDNNSNNTDTSTTGAGVGTVGK